MAGGIRRNAGKIAIPLLVIGAWAYGTSSGEAPSGQPTPAETGVAAASDLAEWVRSQGTQVDLGILAAGCVRVELPGHVLDSNDRAVLAPGGGDDFTEREILNGKARALTRPAAAVVRMAVVGGAETPPEVTVNICPKGERGGFEITPEEGHFGIDGAILTVPA